jgi:hypothetical protein
MGTPETSRRCDRGPELLEYGGCIARRRLSTCRFLQLHVARKSTGRVALNVALAASFPEKRSTWLRMVIYGDCCTSSGTRWRALHVKTVRRREPH